MSTEITSFRAAFDGYVLSLARGEGHAIMSMERCRDAGAAGYRFSEKVPLSAIDDLDPFLRVNNVPSLNGWYREDSALGCSFSLKVEYASGESIAAGGHGGCAVRPPSGWVPERFLKYFMRLVRENGISMARARETYEAEHPSHPC